MNNVSVIAIFGETGESAEPPSCRIPWNNKARLFALKVLKEIKHDNWEFTILLCDDKKITELNNQYRNINKPTDILTFKIDESKEQFPALPSEQDKKTSFYNPGDIVISLDTLKENSLYFKVPEDEELRRLIIHGILHLDGMDHTAKLPPRNKAIKTAEPMLELQEKILNKLDNIRIISDNSGEASSAASRGISSAASRGGKK